MKDQEKDIKITRIYLVSNCYNDPNKVYIGKEKSHQKSGRKTQHKITFGKKAKFEYIDQVNGWNKTQWKPAECFWIKHFKDFGYELMNKNDGGGGVETHTQEAKDKMSKSLIGRTGNMTGKKHSKTTKQKMSISASGKIRSEEHGVKLGKANRKPKPSDFGLKISHIKNTKKAKNYTSKVLQFDLNEKLIKEWTSITEAKRVLGINNISNVCIGLQKTAGGFRWKYKSRKNRKVKKVFQFDLEGNFIKEWKNIMEASKSVRGDVSAVLTNKQKTAGGYMWSYKLKNNE